MSMGNWLMVAALGTVAILLLVERYGGARTAASGEVVDCKLYGRFATARVDPEDKIAVMKVRLDDGTHHKTKSDLAEHAPAVGERVIVDVREGVLTRHTYVTGVRRPAIMGA